MKSQILYTDRTYLRLLDENDVSILFETVSTFPQMAEFMTWNPPQSLEEAQRKFLHTKDRDRPDLNFGIFLKDGDQFIGKFTIRNFHMLQQDAEKRSVFLSFWIIPTMAGKGFGTEVLREVCRYCFEDWQMHKIFAGVFSENIASQKLLQKVGFREIGLLRKHYLKNGIFYDSIRYELLDEDFEMPEQA